MKKILAVFFILCLGRTGAFTEGLSAQGGGKKRHALVLRADGNPYFERMFAGFEEAVREQGFEAICRAPDQHTAEAQIPIIEQLIAERVASICISANDYDALQPVLQKAMNAGIKVTSADSAVNPKSRMIHIDQANVQMIGETIVEAAYDLTGGSGEIAILSATSRSTSQNTWIAIIEKVLKQPRYSGLNMVGIGYGGDFHNVSISETQRLLASFPNIKVIVAPTTVGIVAASKVVTDMGLIGKVKITGLGVPSEMPDYIANGSCPYMFLWNPFNLGYLCAYTNIALVRGIITGRKGDTFAAGRLGIYAVVAADDGGTEVPLGPPFRFDASNINDWKNVY